MEETREIIACNLTGSKTQGQGWVLWKGGKKNKGNVRRTVFCCAVKSSTTKAENVAQVISVAGVYPDTRTTVRANGMT